MNNLRTRFAPSPTGMLHIGGLRTALYSYLFAKKNNGKFILRIEDTDQGRLIEGSIQVIIDTLKQTGLFYDEGPDIGGPYAPYIQSQRKNDYMKYAVELVEKGGAYYCFCSKERLESLPHVNDARHYDKHCLSLSKEEVKERLSQNQPYVIRQNINPVGTTVYHDMVYGDIVIENKELEDNILIKSDGMPTYNFANVVDDHTMDINYVIRGIEFLSSTPKYNLLYDSFGWQRPTYVHLPPIMRDATHKLSKRDGDACYDDFVKKGFTKDAIINYIALLGWSPKNDTEKMSFSQLIDAFGIEGLSKSPAIFDEAKLRWLNWQYLKEMDFDEYVTKATPFILQSKCKNKYDIKKLCKQVKERAETFADIPSLINFLEEFDTYDNELFVNVKLKTDLALTKKVLPIIYDTLSKITEWTNETIHSELLNIAVKSELKNGQVLWPARVALSGCKSTPGGATELADILGKDETLRRLQFSIKQVE